MMEPGFAEPGTEVTLLWGEPEWRHQQAHRGAARPDRNQGGRLRPCPMWRRRATTMPRAGARGRSRIGFARHAPAEFRSAGLVD